MKIFQYEKFFNLFIRVAKSLGDCSGFDMRDYRENISIVAIDLLAQKEVVYEDFK